MGGGLRILLDGSMASRGGGFAYLVNLVPRLAAAYPEDRFLLLLRSSLIARLLPALDNLEVDLLSEADWPSRLRFTTFEAPRRASAWNADLYFSAGEYAPPRCRCPVIASFRNPNVFTSLEQGWPWRQRVRLAVLRLLAKISAATCQRIVFVSEDSARWIGDAMVLPPQRRAVVHHGVDVDAWAPSTRAPRRSRLPGPYILSVSSIYRYKNFVRLIEAYALLAGRRRDVADLVIIGDDQDPSYSRSMAEARRATGSLAQRIHVLGEIPYDEMPGYYAAAGLFVLPSYLETFGHPLLEAMASEVPVVAADIPVFREIASDAAFYADPFSVAALAHAMEQALESSEACQVAIARGREIARAFSWDRTAARLHALFETVIVEGRESRVFSAR